MVQTNLNNFIRAVIVNHNTSNFTELALRSLYATHPAGLDVTTTVLDNNSTDDASQLDKYLDLMNIPKIPTGFSTDTERNSHGEVLGQFVIEHPDCTYYLFLDADICFLEENTVQHMLSLFDEQDDLFGVGVRQSWDGLEEIPTDIHEVIYTRRLHPCCALIKNTPTFRSIVNELGLTGVTFQWVAKEEYWDTFELMTKAMQTHGLRHAICPAMVYHFFSVSYDPRYMERKNRECDQLLHELRIQTQEG